MSTAAQPLRRAKDDWLAKFDGAVIKKTITLGSPTVRHIYARHYDHIGRNCHFISVFGRILLGEDKISEPEAAVYKRLEEVKTSLERKISASRALVVDAGINDATAFNKKEEVEASVIVPVQSAYLKILVLADEYLRLMNSLWLEGEITDKAKSKAELELKQNIRIISATTRKMRIYLQGKLAEAAAKDDAKPETKRAAAEAAEANKADKADLPHEEEAEAPVAAAA